MVRNDFAVLILTHGRAKEMLTLNMLQKVNYSGRWYMVLDNEDDQVPEYVERYGADHCVVFDKAAVAEWTDAGDNFPGRTAILWARNASFEIARDLGLTYFQMLDDDFASIQIKYADADRTKLYGRQFQVYDDAVEMAMDFLDATGALSVAFGQGGDWIGGIGNQFSETPVARKCMNSFICRTDRPFKFSGRMNEDVSTYVRNGMTGRLMFSIMPIAIIPPETQTIAGGMTDEYKDSGTYVKTFYSVMYAPSAVKVGTMKRYCARVHHSLSWRNIAAKIIDPKYKKI